MSRHLCPLVGAPHNALSKIAFGPMINGALTARPNSLERERMTQGITIRYGQSSDRAALNLIYPMAFPDEDLLPVLNALLDEPDGVLSLVAQDGADIIGHVVFTRGTVAGSDAALALLGPLAVIPARQKQGIGQLLVRRGLERLTENGVARVCVLGDPGYYGRFGFVQDTETSPPCPIPDDWAPAWQALSLSDRSAPRGVLTLPAPWQDPALWK